MTDTSSADCARNELSFADGELRSISDRNCCFKSSVRYMPMFGMWKNTVSSRSPRAISTDPKRERK